MTDKQEVQPEKSSLSTLSRSSVVPSTAYIHDDFDPPVMPLAQAQRLGLTKRIERPAPVVASHLLFDVTKTQVSAQSCTLHFALPNRVEAFHLPLSK